MVTLGGTGAGSDSLIILRGPWREADSIASGSEADGCWIGPVWAVVDLTPQSAMFLTKGWRERPSLGSFARSRGIGPGHLLQFRVDVSTTLFVKFLGASGVRLECYDKSSSGSDIDTSSNSDDDSSIFNVKEEGDDSE
ncbi:hypothetical protein D1007_14403 [Hordeum vulgare]|nr:hypothetical protein D1007_14403 [Hordeum vulgare]